MENMEYQTNELSSDSECSNNEIILTDDESDSEPEIECSIWDNDCIIIPKITRKNAIFGFHLMPTCPQEHEVPPIKKQKTIHNPTLNENLTTKEFISNFKQNWDTNTDIQFCNSQLINTPFKYSVIDNFVDDTQVLNKVREEFNEINLNRRSMDLYEFFQSEDLKNVEGNYIKKMYEFLKNDVKEWIEKITGLEFYKISATCSVYSDTDYLLVHDDLENDRSIAFIFYLTDPILGSKEELWTENMGGLLELLDSDEKGHPNLPVQQIIPKNNRFAFFKVTNSSYHQVTEVLNMDHCRLSINGWFHVSTPEKYEPPSLEQPKTGLFGTEKLKPILKNFPLSNWINLEYLKEGTRQQIQKQIENESEICLAQFLQEEIYQNLCNILQDNDIIWEPVGPPNRRKYEVICNKVLPNIIREMLTMFQSKSMFSLLREYTDLDLDVDLKKDINPTVRFELQRWKPGSYSLFSEFEMKKENQLDLFMYFGEHLNIIGGQIMFLSTTEAIENALITLNPKPNCLNIVYHDTARIVKYISHRNKNEYFYMLVCTYKE